MLSIVFDTSNRNLSVGLARDQKLFDFCEYSAWQRQSEFLVAEIDKLLNRNHLTREDIGEVIAAKGPGSYTGVRISLTVAKVMAFALSVPLYLASSLEIYRHGEDLSLCLMNARSKRSYVGRYQGEKIVLPDTILENDEVKTLIEAHPEAKICGDTEYLGIPSANTDVLVNLAKADIVRNRVENVMAAKPVYLKEL